MWTGAWYPGGENAASGKPPAAPDQGSQLAGQNRQAPDDSSLAVLSCQEEAVFPSSAIIYAAA